MHLSACSVSTNSYLIFCLSRCIFNILFNTLDLLDPTQGYTYSISFSLSCLSVLQLCLHSLHNNSTCDQHTAHMHQWMFVFPTFLFFCIDFTHWNHQCEYLLSYCWHFHPVCCFHKICLEGYWGCFKVVYLFLRSLRSPLFMTWLLSLA